MIVPAYNPRNGGAEGRELQMPRHPRLYSKALSPQNQTKTIQTKKKLRTLEKAVLTAHCTGTHKLSHSWVSRPQARGLDPAVCQWEFT